MEQTDSSDFLTSFKQTFIRVFSLMGCKHSAVNKAFVVPLHPGCGQFLSSMRFIGDGSSLQLKHGMKQYC